MILRVAAKAVIFNDAGEVLVVREARSYDEGSQTGSYGLPGGRLDSGERFEDGLAREVAEETGLTVTPIMPVYVGEWRPVIKGEPHQIVAVFVACKAQSTAVQLSDEHDHFEWILPRNRHKLTFMDPDDHVIDAFGRLADLGIFGRPQGASKNDTITI